MKRHFVIASVVILALAVSGPLLAQSKLFVGTWKLNLAKSKYDPGPAPKSQTRTWGPTGKVNVDGLDGAGKPLKYGYTIKTDGKGYPTTGAIPNGADSISTTQIAINTLEATFKRAGKQVEMTTFAVSKDGKVLTITAKGVTPSGTSFNNVNVWDKQ
jgi:hypothetical protein